MSAPTHVLACALGLLLRIVGTRHSAVRGHLRLLRSLATQEATCGSTVLPTGEPPALLAGSLLLAGEGSNLQPPDPKFAPRCYPQAPTSDHEPPVIPLELGR